MSFFLLACWMWPPLAVSGLQVFVWRLVCYVSLIALISSMCAESFFLNTFSIFSLSFNSLIIICLGNILVLFVFRTYWIFMSFIRSGSFIHYSPKYFSAPDSSFPKMAFLHKLVRVMSHRSLECCLHFPINFFLCIKWCLLLSFTVRFFYHPNLLSPSTEISLQCMFNGLFPNSLWLTSEFMDLPSDFTRLKSHPECPEGATLQCSELTLLWSQIGQFPLTFPTGHTLLL